MRDGDYDYIYGVEDPHIDKFLHLARVPVGGLLDQDWEYWTGEGWSDQPALSAQIKGGVANELSIERIGDSYVLVFQDRAIQPHIFIWESDSPQGPWTEKRSPVDIPVGQGQITYNAKAHDEFSTEHSLVITYNVNATTSGGLYSNVDNYRPRFVQVAI